MSRVRQVESEADVSEFLLGIHIGRWQSNRVIQRVVGQAPLAQLDGGEAQAVVGFAEVRILLNGLAVIQGCFLVFTSRKECVSFRYVGLLDRAAA